MADPFAASLEQGKPVEGGPSASLLERSMRRGSIRVAVITALLSGLLATGLGWLAAGLF